MKISTQIRALLMSAFLACSFQKAFAMEAPEPAPIVPISLSGCLPLEVQQRLTTLGQYVLQEILNEPDSSFSPSSLFDEIYPDLEPYLEAATYSRLSSWKPSSLIRWTFSSTDEGYIALRKNQMLEIIALSWALTDLAKQQDEFFERGSFTIIDPEHRLTRFLLEYVKLTTGYQTPETLPFLLTISNFAYRRDPALKGSSHHKGHCPESQFGIDVRFEPCQGVLKLLPFDYTHVLFAKLDLGQVEPLLFFKLEPVGMGGVPEVVAHSFNFYHSQRSLLAGTRREKDIPEVIKAAFHKLQVTANLPASTKTIGAMYVEAQKLLAKQAGVGEMLTAVVEEDDGFIETEAGKFLTMSEDRAGLLNNEETYEAAKAFIELVDTVYKNRNNHVRTGNEVILDLRNYGQTSKVN